MMRRQWDAGPPPKPRFAQTRPALFVFGAVGAAIVLLSYKHPWRTPPPPSGNGAVKTETPAPLQPLDATPEPDGTRSGAPEPAAEGSRASEPAPATSPAPEAIEPAAAQASAPQAVEPAAHPLRVPRMKTRRPAAEEAPPAELPAAAVSSAEPGTWVFHGHVIDLVTLKPVEGASLTFDDVVRSRSFPTSSFPDGRYRVTLPAIDGEGYLLRISHESYLPRWTGLTRAEASSMDPASRLQTALNMARAFETAPQFRSNGPVKALDILVIPKSLEGQK